MFSGWVYMRKTMMFVILACISPCVRNRAATDSKKALRAIKLPCKMGFSARFSAYISPNRETIAPISTPMKGAELQPKFCPKEGTHSTRLKNTSTSAPPRLSKPDSPLGEGTLCSLKNKQAANMAAHMPTHTHIITRQP